MQKVILLAALLFLSGCVVGLGDIDKLEKYCKQNGGGKYINKTWFLFVDPPKYKCQNGATFNE